MWFLLIKLQLVFEFSFAPRHDPNIQPALDFDEGANLHCIKEGHSTDRLIVEPLKIIVLKSRCIDLRI
jgi:hypothetical protein